MLPFLEPKRVVSMLIQRKGKSDLEAHPESGGNSEDSSLEMVMQDLMRAMEKKSPKEMAQAFKAGMQICESYPHEEAEQESEEA